MSDIADRRAARDKLKLVAESADELAGALMRCSQIFETGLTEEAGFDPMFARYASTVGQIVRQAEDALRDFGDYLRQGAAELDADADAG